MDVDVDVLVVLVLVLVEVVDVKSVPSWLYPVFFPNPPISSKVTLAAKFTSLSRCWNRLVFLCMPREKSSNTFICTLSSTSAIVKNNSLSDSPLIADSGFRTVVSLQFVL